jgi:energy-coupling factor transporter transmembrane protein EcfT
MRHLRSVQLADARVGGEQLFGTIGHLAIFFWFLGMVLLASGTRLLATTAICLVVAVILYPGAIRRSLHWRWLIWMLLLSVPSLFFLGERDSAFYGIRYSSEGMLAGLEIALRFVVVLVAVQGFTSSVDIPAVAGLLERLGMQGLGFSLGVALNLLPGLQQSSMDAWQSLRMRGGLRKRWWRGLKLLMVTIMTNALRRAEEVALAAEARAFSPENARPMPVRKGTLDWLPFAVGLPTIVLVVLL